MERGVSCTCGNPDVLHCVRIKWRQDKRGLRFRRVLVIISVLTVLFWVGWIFVGPWMDLHLDSHYCFLCYPQMEASLIFLKTLITVCLILLFILNALMAFHSVGHVKKPDSTGGDIFMLTYFIFSSIVTLFASAIVWVV